MLTLIREFLMISLLSLSSPIADIKVTSWPRPRRPRHSATFLALPPSWIRIDPTCDWPESVWIEMLCAMISTAAPPIMTTFQACGFLLEFMLDNETAISAPSLALFLISSTSITIQRWVLLEADDSPPVSSFTLFSKKGVISAPLIPLSSASFKDFVMAS